MKQRFDGLNNTSANDNSSQKAQKYLLILFLVLLALDLSLIYLSKDLWAIGRILFTAVIMYFTLQGYRWAKWLLIAILSLSVVALMGLVAMLGYRLSTILSVGSVVMGVLCCVIIYYLQNPQVTQFFAQKRKIRQPSDGR